MFSQVLSSRRFPSERNEGVKTEEIRKGRIWAGLRGIWWVCLEILPLQKSKEKRRKTKENVIKT